MWQDEDGKLRCARLANENSQRLLEDRVWSWVMPCQVEGFCFSQQMVCCGRFSHPYGWDSLSTIDTRSLELRRLTEQVMVEGFVN